MKKVFYLFIVLVLLLVLFVYFINNFQPIDINKLNQEFINLNILKGEDEEANDFLSKVIEPENIINYLTVEAYLVFVLFLLIIWFLFVIIHLLVDKLFFKLFYQSPNFSNAYRRGFFLIILVIVRILMPFYKLDFTFLLAVFAIIVLLEYLILSKIISIDVFSYFKKVFSKHDRDRFNNVKQDSESHNNDLHN